MKETHMTSCVPLAILNWFQKLKIHPTQPKFSEINTAKIGHCPLPWSKLCKAFAGKACNHGGPALPVTSGLCSIPRGGLVLDPTAEVQASLAPAPAPAWLPSQWL